MTSEDKIALTMFAAYGLVLLGFLIGALTS